MGSLRSEQGHAERGAALEPGARTVARLVVEIVHGFENGEDALGPDRVAHRERPARIAQAERHRAVEVLRRRDAHLRDVAADVDDVRHHALRDESGRVVDPRDRDTVGGQKPVRRVEKPKSGSTATVRAGSRPSASAVLVASAPSGATKQTESAAGFGSGFAPRAITSSFSSGAAQTEAGRLFGAGGSSSGCAAPS